MTHLKPVHVAFTITPIHYALAALAIIGALAYAVIAYQRQPRPGPDDLVSLAPLNRVPMSGLVVSTPTTVAGLTRFVLDVKEAGEGDVSGKTQVTYRSSDVKVRRGDTVQVIGNVRAVPQGPRGTFLTTRGIFSTVFAEKITRDGKVLYASPAADEADSQG